MRGMPERKSGKEKFLSFLPIFVFSLLLFSFCLPKKAQQEKPVIFSFNILYGANLSYRDLPKFLYAKRNLEKEGPLIAILDSKVFRGDFLYLGEGSFLFSLSRILSGIGIDGVVVKEDFLPIYQKVGREIFDSSQFFFLASNLFRREKGGELKRALFHPVLNKSLNGKRITLLASLLKLTDQWDDYYCEEREIFLRKWSFFLKEKTQLIGCIIDTFFTLPYSPPVFFLEHAKRDSLICYRVFLEDNNLQVKPEGIPLSLEDEELAESISSWERRVEGFLNREGVTIMRDLSREKLEDNLVEFLCRKEGAELFITEKPIFLKGWKKGRLSLRDIWEGLGEKGFLVAGEVSREDIERRFRDKRYLIFPKKGKGKKGSQRVIMTEDLFWREGGVCRRVSYLPYSLFELTLAYLREK